MVGTMKWRLLLSSVVLLFLALTCSAQTITFRVITDQGKPLEKRKVSISLEGFKNGEPIGHGQIQETDKSGEAKFTLPSPPPDHFFFEVEIGSPYWHCGCAGIPKTEEVTQKGIVRTAASKDSTSAFIAQPGEVLVVARQFSLIERLLYPLMKD
jgi:hypothetical protein